MIRINRKKCRVVKGAGLVTRLGMHPSGTGINFYPTTFEHPFDKVSLRLLAEVPGKRISLHEDLHGAYLMHKYLTGKWHPQRPLSPDQDLIDEINAFRDDVNTGGVTWEEIKDKFKEHYVPEVSRKYNLLSKFETEKLLKLSKKAIDIVAE